MSYTLPPDWSSAVDASSGRTYYFHAQTGETSWSPPIPPPPLPPSHPPAPTIAQPLPPPPDTLVARAQVLVDHLEQRPEIQAELDALTPGQISDLDYLQREQNDSTATNAPPNDYYYQPIQPRKHVVTAERPPAEPTRLETRVHALYQELDRLR